MDSQDNVLEQGQEVTNVEETVVDEVVEETVEEPVGAYQGNSSWR